MKKNAKSNVQDFINHCKFTKNLSEKTIKAYISDLKSFLSYTNEFSPDKIYGYIEKLLSDGRKGSTVKRRLSTLNQYFDYIFRDNQKDNPIKKTSFNIKTEKLLPRTLSIAEIKALFKAIETEGGRCESKFARFENARNLALFDVICSTGIRIGEASAITLSDVDLVGRTIIIHGKGRKERIVYLSCRDTVNNLGAWLKLRKTLNPANRYVFLNRQRERLSVHGIEDIFKKYQRLAKINPDATPHYLRHTFATNLLANGSDLRSVQELLGHSSVAVTERYTEVTPTRKIAVLKKYNYRNNLLKPV